MFTYINTHYKVLIYSLVGTEKYYTVAIWRSYLKRSKCIGLSLVCLPVRISWTFCSLISHKRKASPWNRMMKKIEQHRLVRSCFCEHNLKIRYNKMYHFGFLQARVSWTTFWELLQWQKHDYISLCVPTTLECPLGEWRYDPLRRLLGPGRNLVVNFTCDCSNDSWFQTFFIPA